MFALYAFCREVDDIADDGLTDDVQAALEGIGLTLPLWAQGALGTGEGRVFNVIAARVTLGDHVCDALEIGNRRRRQDDDHSPPPAIAA